MGLRERAADFDHLPLILAPAHFYPTHAMPYARTSNNLAKIRRSGLNSFGEPYTGNPIRGVVNRREFSGGSGPLSKRGPQATGEVAAMEKAAAEEARAMQAARAAGQARARAESPTPAGAAPKPQGQLVESSRGGYKWQPAPAPASSGGGGWFGGMVEAGKQALLVEARRQRGMQAAKDRKKGRVKAYRERE